MKYGSDIPAWLWKQMVGKEPVAEYKFHQFRRWRFDYAFVENKLSIEIEGGLWSGGRHITAPGYLRDMEKYNAATELGWRVLRYQPGVVDWEQVKRCLSSSPA